MSNFEFLRHEWSALYGEAARAERHAFTDPRASCFYARRSLELALQWLYDADSLLKRPYRDDLSAMVGEPSLLTVAGQPIRTKMDLIRRQGNIAVHRQTPVTPQTATQVVRELFHVMYWLARTYTRDPANLPAAALAFDQNLVPRPVSPAAPLGRAELKTQEEKHAARDKALAAGRAKSADLDAQIAALRAEIKQAKAANRTRPETHDYNEAETRTLLIDLLLKEAGWSLAQPRDREFPVDGLPTSHGRSGKGRVDYVLWDDDGKPLGIVEAKRTARDPLAGQQQAQLYAAAMERRFGQRPIIFCSNGYQTYIWDDETYPIRSVAGFYTKDELRLLVQRRANRRSLTRLPINEEIVNRHYQARAIRRIGETFERQQRHALLVMATGAGKTRTVIALADLLARGNWVRRVLFLCDRQALVTQAFNAFKRHLPGMPVVNLLGNRRGEGRVYISTYPTMAGLIDEMTDTGERRFGPGFFDLIVIDEAHRSIYQKYGALFDYFDALLVGLTATPKDEVDRNTYRRFELEDGVPTDSYDLDEAVKEHYLVPPRVVDVPLKFLRHGIRYADLSQEEKDRWDELEWDTDDGRVPDSVNTEELNRWLFNADTVDKALATLMTHGGKVAGGDRLGKTIIFAKNQKHAEFIAKRFDANYPEYRGQFARVITHQTEQAQSLIDQFATRDAMPHIAISVDMLDTGIDIPEVVNLVFFKLVRSKTKFWQMVGRGTRLCPDLFGPNDDKQAFLVFDLCMNVEYFNQNLPTTQGSIQPSLSERLFSRRADLLLALDQQRPEIVANSADTSSAQPSDVAGEDSDGTRSDTGLRWDTARRLHQDVAGMNPTNFIVRPHWEQVVAFADFAAWRKPLSTERHAEVTTHLAGLPTAYREDENSEEAKRFDLLALRLQLSLLHADPGYQSLRKRVMEIAESLLTQTTIPVISAQQQLLDELLTEEWWQDATLPMLERMRRNIRGLVKLIERTQRRPLYTDFEDEALDARIIDLTAGGFTTDRSRFEAKVRTYLHSHEDHLAVQKLRRNVQITSTDLSELERIFIESAYGTREDIDQVAAESQGFGLFLRSLTGLERGAAAAAFDNFQASRNFDAAQLDFLNLVIDYLARNGTIETADLFGQPFVAKAPGGPGTLFQDPADVVAIRAIFQSVHDTAVPVDGPEDGPGSANDAARQAS